MPENRTLEPLDEELALAEAGARNRKKFREPSSEASDSDPLHLSTETYECKRGTQYPRLKGKPLKVLLPTDPRFWSYTVNFNLERDGAAIFVVRDFDKEHPIIDMVMNVHDLVRMVIKPQEWVNGIAPGILLDKDWVEGRPVFKTIPHWKKIELDDLLGTRLYMEMLRLSGQYPKGLIIRAVNEKGLPIFIVPQNKYRLV